MNVAVSLDSCAEPEPNGARFSNARSTSILGCLTADDARGEKRLVSRGEAAPCVADRAGRGRTTAGHARAHGHKSRTRRQLQGGRPLYAPCDTSSRRLMRRHQKLRISFCITFFFYSQRRCFLRAARVQRDACSVANVSRAPQRRLFTVDRMRGRYALDASVRSITCVNQQRCEGVVQRKAAQVILLDQICRLQSVN